MLSSNLLHVTDARESYYFLPEEIIRLQAHDNYTHIYINKRHPFVVSRVLKCYEEMLKPFGFVRTHRSHLVNQYYIKSVNSNTIEMKDASIAGLSRRKRSGVIEQLKMALPQTTV